MTDNDLILGLSHYGGPCPQCDSKDTALWLREIDVPDGYNDWQEWLTCHSCRHEWTEAESVTTHTYLLNNGYTEESLRESVDRIKSRVRELMDKDSNHD